MQKNDNHLTTITTNLLLVAVGRKPNIDGLGLDNVGVAYTNRGIQVRSTLRTTARNIYACGDVVGPYQFSHMADYQAIIASYNACIPFFKKHVDYRHVLWVTFSAPEFARFGLTEEEAIKKYGAHGYHVYRVNFNEVDRPVIEENKVGLAKIICDKRGHMIGAHILGDRAGELIHELQVGRRFTIPLAKFNSVIHAYPTYSDVIKKAGRIAYIDAIERNFFIRMIKKLRWFL